ncbi:MAG: glutathione transport system permease protein [Microbacteriaceae bacterium]|jgi:peptide/nickel transport system permease protein|nr:glutathione transport system permease protein [Microbacteriaceae bacterium]
MTIGPLPPVGSNVGLGPHGEDPRSSQSFVDKGGAPVESTSIELREVEGLSLGRVVRRRFLHHRAAIISLIVLAVVVVMSFSAIGIHIFGVNTGGWWRWNFDQVPNIVNGGQPTLTLVPFDLGLHPFGQDSVGHDMFAMVMRGIQQSLMIVFVTGVVSTVIGTVLGAFAGYFGGIIDSLLMRLTDMVIIVPLLLLAAIVGKSVNGPSVYLALVLGFLVWTTLARLVRGEVLALREREFVDAARVAGASSGRIMFRHILPNTVGVIVVSATLTMSATILLETAISYLGFGVHAPDVSLGLLISNYQTAFNTRPWLFWWPGIFIVIIALTINFIGDGLRDAFDPRQRRGLKRSARLDKKKAELEAAAQAGS